MDTSPHILVVDDSADIRDPLAKYLSKKGLRVSTADGGQELRRVMKTSAIDLVILDVMMPGEDGLSLARALREEGDVAILMLSARSEPGSRIEGLEMGADDYLAKPFEPRELLLRIESILRRQGPNVSTASEISMGACTFHVERGELRRDGVTVRLTTRERELLRLFASRPGKTITRAELSGHGADGGARAVDVQINRLRRKIEADPATPVYLQTVRGSGYILYTD